MPGGKRPGAGRKSGEAWKGAAPRDEPLRKMARSRVREVLATQQDPIAVLVNLANDEKLDAQVRIQAAASAAPFIFPRLSASVVANAVGPASKEDHAHLIERILGRLNKLDKPTPLLIDGEAA